MIDPPEGTALRDALDEAITRFVTGDGRQLENLTMSDAEWADRLQRWTEGERDIEVTIHPDDWMVLIRHARKRQPPAPTIRPLICDPEHYPEDAALAPPALRDAEEN